MMHPRIASMDVGTEMPSASSLARFRDGGNSLQSGSRFGSSEARSSSSPSGVTSRRRPRRRRLLTIGTVLFSAASPTSAFSLAFERVGRLSGVSPALSHRRSSFVGQRLAVYSGIEVALNGLHEARTAPAGSRAGALWMGIPKLFRWLTDQYPAISKRLDQGLNEVSQHSESASSRVLAYGTTSVSRLSVHHDSYSKTWQTNVANAAQLRTCRESGSHGCIHALPLLFISIDGMQVYMTLIELAEVVQRPLGRRVASKKCPWS